MDYFQIQEMNAACRKIWKGYKMYAQTAAVMRSGYMLTGVCEEQEGAGDLAMTFCQRGESGLEHQAKVAWLALAFIGVTGVSIFNAPYSDGLWQWLLANTALCHDVGETEVGDIPDDGNAQHGTKDAKELETFERLAEIYSSLDSRRMFLKGTFKHFQRKDDHNGQAIYALDKLEAVLTLINLERMGRIGSIMSKPNPTEQDLYYVAQTGSDNPVDCWAAHMRSQIEGFPEEIYVPVMTLLDTAIRDVRGKGYDWWDKDIPPFEPNK